MKLKPEIEAVLILSGVKEALYILKEATWIAQDADGEWWSYTRKPIEIRRGIWDADNESCGERMAQGDDPTDASKMIFKL